MDRFGAPDVQAHRSPALRRNQVDNPENRNVPIIDFVDNAHLASVASRDAAPAVAKPHGMPNWCLARNFCRTERTSMKSEHRNPNFATNPNKEPKLSRTHAPTDLSVVEWQRRLRRQFGREQDFGLENLGSEPFFSEFRVSNPVSKSSYRVAIRGLGPGGNFCSCPDYATSELGTCKHLEFTLARLEKKRGAKTAFARGYQPAFSELYLRNEGGLRMHFRAGTDCPAAVREAAAVLFDAEHDGMLPDDRLGELQHFMTTASKCDHELRAYDDALDFVAGRRDADRPVVFSRRPVRNVERAVAEEVARVLPGRSCEDA
jgi:hypothetical protein